VAYRFCRACSALIPAQEFGTHVQRHRSRARERQGSRAGWRTLREQVLDRDGHACVVCGSHTKLEVHHVDGDWRNDQLSNLQTRCFACHPRGRGTPA